MHRFAAAIAAMALIAAGASPALAAPCKDAKGKFIKCPPPPPAKVACKDAKGKFIKCPPVKKAPCKDAKGKFVKCK